MAGVDMTKWEYRRVYRPDDEIWLLNNLGEEGWELVSMDAVEFILKREKVSPVENVENVEKQKNLWKK
jgi:hypothetical protein